MSNLTTYLVKLTPLSIFFFGNEQGETADYYLKGNNFPQQTALLGLVRHQLLIQNNFIGQDQKITNKVKAGELIGSAGFQFNNAGNFGVIDKLSACFIIDKDNKQYHPSASAFALNIGKAGNNYFFKEFDAKEHYSLCLKAIDGNVIQESIIFENEDRPGIDKPYTATIQEKQYFKQAWTKLKEGYSFGFYITIDKSKFSETVNFDDAFVTFGKESMPFKMEVYKQEQTVPEINTAANAVVLLSDTYVADDITATCDLAVTDTVPFRNVFNKTTQDYKEYHKIPREGNAVRLQLIKKGSVLFSADRISVIISAIDNHHNFKSIGYNHYQQLKLSITK